MRKTFLTILSALLVCITILAGCKAQNGGGTEQSQSAPSTTETTAVTTTTAPSETASEIPSVSETEESTTAESTTEKEEKPDYSAIQKGAWYLYNEDDNTAYAFKFDKSKVKIAYFDSENTDGLDTKFFTSNEKYEVNEVEGEIIIQVPDPMNENEEFNFTLKKGKVYYGKKALENRSKISLEAAFNHFNG